MLLHGGALRAGRSQGRGGDRGSFYADMRSILMALLAFQGLFHGKDDPVVEHRHAESTLATLQSAQIEVSLTSYATLGHSCSIGEILDVIAWLQTLNIRKATESATTDTIPNNLDQ